MKYLITINNLSDIKKGAIFDGFLFALNNLAKGFDNYFLPQDATCLLKEVSMYTKELYLVLNDLYKDSDYELLSKYLAQFDFHKLSGIFISDLGLIPFFKELGYDKLILNIPSLIKSRSDFNFFKNKVIGEVISPSLSIEEIISIANKAKITPYLLLYGDNFILNTIRKLITNYKKHYNIKLNSNANFSIEESLRQGYFYPIKENSRGSIISDCKKIDFRTDFNKLSKSKIKYLIINTFATNFEDAIKIKKELSNGNISA